MSVCILVHYIICVYVYVLWYFLLMTCQSHAVLLAKPTYTRVHVCRHVQHMFYVVSRKKFCKCFCYDCFE